MLLKVYLLLVAVVVTQAEPPTGRAPYAAAGWRPEVPFNLPGEFQIPVGASFEVSQQRVEHAGTFNAPQFNVPQREQQQEQLDTGSRDRQPTPSNQYGPAAAPVGDFRIIYPEEEDSAALNQPQSKIKEGQNYIVSPDNKLQRVLYRTEDAAKGADFTAQLKYSSVGELQDPVYKYNSQGQLQRVLK